MKKIEIFLLMVILIISCNNNSKQANNSAGKNLPESKLAGAWVQPNPINDKEVQGFVLKPEGSAESINFETLKYRKWWFEADSLCLVVESIGNGVSLTDTVRYKLVSVNDIELVLRNGQTDLVYSRK